MHRFTLIFFSLFIVSGSCLNAREASGIVVPFKEVVLSAATENTVQKMHVELGDEVVQGQLLAELDSRIHKLQVKRFERVLDMSESTYRGTSQLVKEKIISREDALKAEIERDLAINQLEVSKVELSRQNILSPLSGIVVEVMKEEGETVKKSEEMFVVVNIDKVYLQIFLLAEDANTIIKGQQLDVHFPTLTEQKDFKGEVYYIDPRVDANSGMLGAKILIENVPHMIRAGLRGFVSLPDRVD